MLLHNSTDIDSKLFAANGSCFFKLSAEKAKKHVAMVGRELWWTLVASALTSHAKKLLMACNLHFWWDGRGFIVKLAPWKADKAVA